MDKQQFSPAASDMTAALRLMPNSPSLLYQRAMAHFAMRDNEAALQVGCNTGAWRRGRFSLMCVC